MAKNDKLPADFCATASDHATRTRTQGSWQMARMSGGKAVVESLRAEGVKHVFSLIGSAGMEIFDSSAFTDDLSDELHRYPNDGQLVAPLQERGATWSLTSGRVPAGARRAGRRPHSRAPTARRGRR